MKIAASLLALLALMLAGCARSHQETVLERVRAAGAVPTGNDRVFQVRPREAALETFPCQRCHKVPLAQMKHDGKDGKPRAHWSIRLKHADDTVMNCSTCHEPADLNVLKTVTGKPVSINASWQVCSQCHSKQASDWAGGAHGKRAVGWDSARVSQTCTECHNPHKPAWDTRAPVHVELTGVAGGKDGR